MRRAPVFLFISILTIAVLLSACSGIDLSSTTSTPYGYEIDPIFWAFFKQNGGTDRFGAVVSTLFSNNTGKKMQYVESGLLVYDPEENEFYFASLGLDLNLSEPANPDLILNDDDLVLNGYLVHPAFVDYYHDMGSELIGPPISNPRYNYAKNRLEQHFENFGLYYLLDDPDKTPHLLSYGLLACGTACPAYTSIQESKVIWPVNSNDFTNYINAQEIPESLLGDPVSGPLNLYNGATVVIYNNMGLSSSEGIVSIIKIPAALGYSSSDLYPEITNPALTFIAIRDGMGHNVFIAFDEFIKSHGGYHVSGNPTTELYTLNLETNTIRQCFENLCLDYYPDALEANVRPAPIGEEYLNQVSDQIISDSEVGSEGGTITPRTSAIFSLYVWESDSAINSTSPQTISVMVFSHGTAQSRQHLELRVTYPDGSSQLFNLPETNQNGRTGTTIPPIPGENGDLVEYQVCLTIKNQVPICIKDSFMIWGNP